MIVDNWQEGVLDFWFQKMTPKQWFVSDVETDKLISDTFKPLVLALAEALPSDVKSSADKSLAAIICFDQFTRNIFRGQGQAFAYDHIALSLSQNIVEQGWDQEMDDNHKQFSYMPYMHSEDLNVQKMALKLFKPFGEDTFKFAQDHHDIIERFGCYPHRNDVLGRKNTPEEIEYLKDAKRFGQ